MAEVLARAIAEQAFGVRYDGPPQLSVIPNRPIPPAEPIQGVPDKYLAMVGDHADHPGEGKGRRSRKLRRTADG